MVPDKPRVVGLPGAREAALKRLNEAYVANLLELPEFETRVAAVEAARSLDEVEGQVSDLPSGAVVTEIETLDCQMGTKHVSGGQLKARRVEARVSMGTLKLDYRQAALPEGVLELDLDVHLGECKIWLPDGCDVENRIAEQLSTVKVHSQASDPGRPARTTLRLSGKANLSTVKVYRGHWWANFKRHVLGPK